MYKVGDLFWSQISMWDFSDKSNVDMYNDGGFHYELFIITEVISENHYKHRHIKYGEISEEQLSLLIPEKGHNWFRVMGNREDLV